MNYKQLVNFVIKFLTSHKYTLKLNGGISIKKYKAITSSDYIIRSINLYEVCYLKLSKKKIIYQ